MRTLVLLNPEAGSAEDRNTLKEALARLPGVELSETHSGADVRARARGARAAGYERVVAAGGDGTIHDVVNGLAESSSRAVLGIVPMGTANDFARSLDLPEDLEQAVAILAAGHARPVDLIEARGRTTGHFVNVAVGGFGGHVQERADPARKRVLGPLEYLRSAAEGLPELKAHRVRMEADGELLEVEAFHLVVANGSRSGGNIPIAPEARLDDGLLDIVLIPALEVGALLLLVSKILIGKHLKDENVIYRRAATVGFRSNPHMRFSLDGEAFGEDPVEFRTLPGALEVIVPAA